MGLRDGRIRVTPRELVAGHHAEAGEVAEGGEIERIDAREQAA
jgi:hypothetical protein